MAAIEAGSISDLHGNKTKARGINTSEKEIGLTTIY